MEENDEIEEINKYIDSDTESHIMEYNNQYYNSRNYIQNIDINKVVDILDNIIRDCAKYDIRFEYLRVSDILYPGVLFNIVTYDASLINNYNVIELTDKLYVNIQKYLKKMSVQDRHVYKYVNKRIISQRIIRTISQHFII